jgi:hypothetical protein
MHLANIGEMYIDKFGIPGDYDKPVPPPDYAPQKPPTHLDVNASVRYVIVGRQGTQTVFVYVNNQMREPVENAAVRITVHYQSGDQTYTCNPTNANGFTKCSFSIQPSPPGEKVVIDVQLDYGGLTATTQTFFLPWW